jgi:hypothetical protein
MQLQKRGVIASNHDLQDATVAFRLDQAAVPAGRPNHPDWHLAGERMLLYLKALGMDPEDQLGLSLEALRRARAQRSETADPVSECLTALWQVLEERRFATERSKPLAIGADRRSSRNRKPWQSAFQRQIRFPMHVQVQPTLQRRRMISAPMELAPWRRAVLQTTQAVRNPVEEWLYRKGAFLGGLFILLAVLALK